MWLRRGETGPARAAGRPAGTENGGRVRGGADGRAGADMRGGADMLAGAEATSPAAQPGVLDIVPIFFGNEQPLLDPLAAWLEQVFALPVRRRAPWFDPEDVFDANRSQYNSTLLLAELLADPQAPAPKILGVTSVDLFIPILTYVFGEAQLAGRAAIVSTHRLRSEAYGLPPDEPLLVDRLIKEATHELGHTYGLIHCRDASCVMRASTYVEEIDLKSARFCPACWSALAPRPA